MDQFVWKENFNIGIAEIDRQHQMLLNFLNECIQKVSLADDNFDFHALLGELQTYTDRHFKTEEELMQSVNYPEFDLHRKKHRLLVEQIDKMKKEDNTGKRHAIVNLTALLKDWFMQHILEEDQRIEVYLLARIKEQQS
jgi:hemerythrin-like metal-binding protein